jgi:hypothetical protein
MKVSKMHYLEMENGNLLSKFSHSYLSMQNHRYIVRITLFEGKFIAQIDDKKVGDTFRYRNDIPSLKEAVSYCKKMTGIK